MPTLQTDNCYTDEMQRCLQVPEQMLLGGRAILALTAGLTLWARFHKADFIFGI